MDLYFSDYFNVSRQTLADQNILNISLITDLPLFIDPFLLFNSDKESHQNLHAGIIQYLRFLRDKAINENGIRSGLLDEWYRFPEVEENWLGFTKSGNSGRGLGKKFAKSLHRNLTTIFQNFSDEEISRSSHLEKLCLIEEGVGKDCISDFTTNLIKAFLADFTEKFAIEFIDKSLLSRFTIERVVFNYETESWQSKTFTLPNHNGHFVILTPRDILTRDESWINKEDILDDIHNIICSVPNETLRSKINNYFFKMLPFDSQKKERIVAARKTIRKFPELVDYYIRYKENNGRDAVQVSSLRVDDTENLLIENISRFIDYLYRETVFFSEKGNSYENSMKRVLFLKQVIENEGGYKYFYSDDKPIEREDDLQIAYRLIWYGTRFDVNREVNNGRGPADFKISEGSKDKTIVEMKLARNSQLKRNLKNQAEIYAKANQTKNVIKVILYFNAKEMYKTKRILHQLGLDDRENIVLIDARMDNKTSASRAR